ncbi:MAG: nucleoside-diphosphate kinase [Candidatus Midichloria sp.]|nr:MAG: nucleoside-diphosphate kinase [Candidatus Midichloria sp.]
MLQCLIFKEKNVEQTLSIIKPDAVKKGFAAQINERFEKAGLKIVRQKKLHLTKEQAEAFYGIHKERPFFNDLVEYMTFGEIVVQVLEGENAVMRNREIMGATDPKAAASGTIRKDFGQSIEANGVHGSDSLENAKNEIKFFFDN